MHDQSAKYFPIMERFFASKLSAKEFSEQSGIKVTTLDYWKKRCKAKDKNFGQGSGIISDYAEGLITPVFTAYLWHCVARKISG